MVSDAYVRCLTGITITDGALLEEGVQDQEVIVGGGLLQGLDVLGGFVELLQGTVGVIEEMLRM